MARHTAKSHKIRKVEILVIQILSFRNQPLFAVLFLEYILLEEYHNSIQIAIIIINFV